MFTREEVKRGRIYLLIMCVCVYIYIYHQFCRIYILIAFDKKPYFSPLRILELFL